MKRRVLALILILFVALGAIYSIVVPPFEASDEKWHYPMVKYIADHWTLPVQVPGVDTSWRQEGSQPPLYYALAAAATFWIDTLDMDMVRHLNPHVDAGATPDGNVNLVVHDQALERFPWRGTVLALHLIRFLSVLMGGAAVYLTYRIASEALPDRPALALGAATVHAFTPMVIFISGSVNNDTLAMALSSLGLWMLVRIANRKSQIAAREYVLLGVVLGLAALTKTSTLPLTVLTALVVAVRAVRGHSWREFFIGGIGTLVPFLGVAGWWFLRNLRFYGDLTGLDVFIQVLGQRDVSADLAQLWRERFSFLAGYWGNFGGLNVPMAQWVYQVLNAIVPIAALGALVVLGRSLVAYRRSPSDRRLPPSRINFPLVLCLLFAMLVFVSWLGWARVTWSSQGRLVFTAVSAWSVLLVVGLAGWLPRRWGRLAVAALAFFLLGLAVAVPFVWIAPAYALPEPLTDAQVAAIPNRLDVDFGPAAGSGQGDAMRLLGYDLETGAVEPGGQVAVTLYWQALASTDQNYTVFVHLLGKEERLIAQRDTFPGLGLFSTTRLKPGDTWADRYVLRVPDTAYTPDQAQIEVGLYDASSGVRLLTSTDSDAVHFGQVELTPRPGDVPNPISVNFGDQMELVGYDLDRWAARPGEQVTLTLYWRPRRPMERNYTVSAQFVDAGQVKAGQRDSWPADGAMPTSVWERGQLVADARVLVINDVPPGVYEVWVAVYVQEDGGFVHLPVISDVGEMLANHQILTRVRVMP